MIVKVMNAIRYCLGSKAACVITNVNAWLHGKSPVCHVVQLCIPCQIWSCVSMHGMYKALIVTVPQVA